MSVRRVSLSLLAVCTLLLTAVACGGSGSSANGTPASTRNQVAGRVVHLKLTDKMTFDPPMFTVKTHERITLELENDGKLKHNFTIDSLNISKDVAPGGAEYVDFTAPSKPGQIAFTCDVPGHSAAGMVGTLVIEQ